MNNPSKATGTDVPKSDKQLPEKDQKPRMTTIEKEVSALIIQRAWFIHVDKTIFQLLKHTICAAEQFVAHEILKTVSPIEAKLVKDPSMKCKVRFRFNGETFPPFIVFKIFLHGDGSNNKYFSGKNLLKPSSKAVLDACNIMGKRKFHQQIMEDDRLFQESKIADQIDIVTMQDYLQEPQKDTQSTKKQEMIVISTSSLDIVKVKDSTSDSEFEKEEKELFAWYQDLYVDYSSLLDTC
uniref:Uncharacterized protein n=1 Tax=Castor canadensis TaxID=51338 RepID=A0A8C0X1F9_CASCN